MAHSCHGSITTGREILSSDVRCLWLMSTATVRPHAMRTTQPAPVYDITTRDKTPFDNSALPQSILCMPTLVNSTQVMFIS